MPSHVVANRFQCCFTLLARPVFLPQNHRMKRSTALEKLKPMETALRAQGISALYLFGSVARDVARDDSDIDLLFEVLPQRRFSLFDQAGLQVDLSEALQTHVDFVPRMALRPRMRERVEAEMIRVF
jgi:predicted nucleotidyltransferase